MNTHAPDALNCATQVSLSRMDIVRAGFERDYRAYHTTTRLDTLPASIGIAGTFEDVANT